MRTLSIPNLPSERLFSQIRESIFRVQCRGYLTWFNNVCGASFLGRGGFGWAKGIRCYPPRPTQGILESFEDV
jgi:hypothetical protein